MQLSTKLRALERKVKQAGAEDVLSWLRMDTDSYAVALGLESGPAQAEIDWRGKRITLNFHDEDSYHSAVNAAFRELDPTHDPAASDDAEAQGCTNER